ncbi:MAG: deoxyribonuclease IV [Chitinispirillaceae bacterium]|nr:deoxyribonuclease IV [Chitinispirillaceae bacterium]
MKRIGPHVSITGGVQEAPFNARAVGATAFGMFTKNQRQWVVKPYDGATIDAFKKNLAECGYAPHCVLAHDSYLINIGNPDRAMRQKSLTALIDELTRCGQLGLSALNIHPGSHLRAMSEEECCILIAESINRALEKTAGVTVVLENTAGQGSNIGYRFEQLAMIINAVDDKSRVGCCFDTCHAFAAGYDIRTAETYRQTTAAFDRVVGLRYLRGLHINDAKSSFGSRVDRHHSIGEGALGWETFRLFMTDPRFDDLPMILETIDEGRWPAEIRRLSAMAGGTEQQAL